MVFPDYQIFSLTLFILPILPKYCHQFDDTISANLTCLANAIAAPQPRLHSSHHITPALPHTGLAASPIAMALPSCLVASSPRVRVARLSPQSLYTCYTFTVNFPFHYKLPISYTLPILPHRSIFALQHHTFYWKLSLLFSSKALLQLLNSTALLTDKLYSKLLFFLVIFLVEKTMPRSREEQPSDGILTVNDVADLISVSLTTVRRWFDEGEFQNGFRIHDTKERRIPAPSLYLFLTRKKMPIPRRLSDLVAAYDRCYQSRYQLQQGVINMMTPTNI